MHVSFFLHFHIIVKIFLKENYNFHAIRLRFKYFQNVEGEIVVPDGFVPEKIEISAVAEAPVAKRVDQEFEWGK